ncbi:trigger factor, partial [Parageobacillus sp. SY1]
LELYYQFSGQDEAALREQMKEDAEKRVRVALTIEAIAKAENIEVTEEEINEELEKMAKAYNLEVEKLKELLGNLDGVKEDLKWRKTIDFLVENSKVAA